MTEGYFIQRHVIIVSDIQKFPIRYYYIPKETYSLTISIRIVTNRTEEGDEAIESQGKSTRPGREATEGEKRREKLRSMDVPEACEGEGWKEERGRERVSSI